MLEKTQKRFSLTIGSNRKEVTQQDLINMALWLENTGNETPNGFKFHIFISDEEFSKSDILQKEEVVKHE